MAEDPVIEPLGPEQLAALLDFSTDAIMLVDADGVIRWASDSTTAVLGYAPGDLIGVRVKDLIDPADLDAWRGLVADMLDAPGEPMRGTFRCRHKDGSVRFAEGVVRNLLHEPRIAAAVLYYRDVTPQRETEAALVITEDRYRHLFEEATDIIFDADEEGYFRFVNPVTLRAFGYEPPEVIGRRFTEFVRPDHRERVFNHYRHQTQAGERTSYIEFPAITKDGQEIWLGQNAWMVVDAEGRFRGFQAVARNITERREAEVALREAEAKYRAVVEHSGVAVYILQDGRIAYVNPRGADLLGYDAAALLAFAEPFDIIAEGDRPFVRAELARLSDETPTVQVVTRALARDGRVLHWEAFAARTNFGGRPAILATVVDISERLALEEQLRQAQKMEAVGRLAGGIAHDFNNLLAAIQGNAELLHHRFARDRVVAADIEEILSAADRAATLIRQLLAFSRKQHVRPIRLDVNEVVDGVARMARRVIGTNVLLEVRTAPDAPAVVVDPAQLEQVLLNLVINARDALPEGGRITVRTGPHDLAAGTPDSERTGLAAGRYLRLAVSDTGIGMDQATQARIFEPFFTTKEPGRGTGLGLSTVYGLVRQMGGAVTVRSQREAGSTFEVFLPAAAGPAGEPRPAQGRPSTSQEA